ncbi:hypothetical protein [Bacillus salipaludis]|uniref:Uncharacterized protein n=1 Tax=Bacillus salipaludis TaxID=2547811 RepID=A0AA90TWT4_9BACI|nr:hypothetical protein [Bacillus salipaludis]MDQ6601009.1 hypothetical protein [Bacillus salipaludis]
MKRWNYKEEKVLERESFREVIHQISVPIYLKPFITVKKNKNYMMSKKLL